MYHLVKSLYLHATSLPEYSLLLLGLDAAGKTTLHNQIKNIYGHHAVSHAFPTSSSSRPQTSSDANDTTDNADTTTAMHASQSAGKTVPTVGQNVSLVTLPDCYLKIWDVGGQHSLRGLWQSYYASCHAIIFVLDSTDLGDADITRLPRGMANGADGVQQENGAAMAGGNAAGTGSGGGGGGSRGAEDSEEYGRLLEARLVLESVLQHSDATGVPLLVLANKQDREDSVEVVRIKEGFVRRVVEGEGEKGGSFVRDSRVLPCSALTGTGVKEAVEWVCSRVKWNREARPPVMR